VDWQSLAVGGAFALGLAAGAVGTVRLTRAIWDTAFRARRRLEDEDP